MLSLWVGIFFEATGYFDIIKPFVYFLSQSQVILTKTVKQIIVYWITLGFLSKSWVQLKQTSYEVACILFDLIKIILQGLRLNKSIAISIWLIVKTPK